jgi:hypothetical protein
VRVRDVLAANRIPLLAYHFPWPGIGQAAKAGEGSHYYPMAMKMEL